MKLLSATPSPYARKVRIALQEKELPFELITEVPWNQDASAPSLNPLGKIPVLIPDEGEPIYESRLILEYLELMYPQPPLVPADPFARFAHRRMEALCDGLCDATGLVVIERTRPAELQSARWIERQKGKVERALAAADASIGDGSAFVLGDAFGLADIALGCALGYLDIRLSELDWRAAHPRLAARFERLSERPSFRDTVPMKQTFRDRIA